jgi:ABC-type polysaccharide/polyol phosphate export permease
VLGPFWLTISMGVLVGTMGPLYSRLFSQDATAYFPFLAVGVITWQLMAALVSDGGQVFIAAEPYITQLRMPYTIHVLRMVWRNAVIFAHNFLIVILVLVVFLPGWSWNILLAVPGVIALLVNGIWLGMFLGMLCLRFRDILPLVANVIQIAFFLTPVMWRKEMLGRNQWAADFNPLYHFLEVVRTPLLGAQPSAVSWAWVLGVTLAGYALTIAFLSRYRRRIAYWI